MLFFTALNKYHDSSDLCNQKRGHTKSVNTMGELMARNFSLSVTKKKERRQDDFDF
jgi:hypothetical protein